MRTNNVIINGYHNMISFIFCLLLSSYSVCFPNDTSSSKISGSIPVNDHAPADIVFKIDSLFQILSTKRGFNGNVLIAQGGKVIYENTFGYADLEEKTPLNI